MSVAYSGFLLVGMGLFDGYHTSMRREFQSSISEGISQERSLLTGTGGLAVVLLAAAAKEKSKGDLGSQA